MRIEQDGRYSAATGAKNYRWMESEMVKNLHLEDQIDYRYFDDLLDDAINDISKYEDINIVTSNDIAKELVSDPLPESFNLANI